MMPKSLKWGIVIMLAALVLFLAGYVFREQMGNIFRNWWNASDLPSDLQETVFPSSSDEEGRDGEERSPFGNGFHSVETDEK